MKGLMILTLMFTFYIKSDEIWEMQKKVYAKSQVNKQEHDLREAIFNENKNIVTKNNLLQDTNKVSFRLGLNNFADQTFEEFKLVYLNQKPSQKKKNKLRLNKEEIKMNTVSSVDWRDKGALTPIKNQLQCGSCWAFSATESVESAQFLSTNQLPPPLSVQQTVSCDKTDDGCGGGSMESAFAQMKSAGCIESAANYPQTSGKGASGTCKFNKNKCVIDTDKLGYKTVGGIFGATMSEIMSAVALRPLSIAVAANDAWQLYTGGVLTLAECPDNQANHGVQMVGYTSEAWIVRNSWGSTWGESGFIRLEKASYTDTCSYQSDVSYPHF